MGGSFSDYNVSVFCVAIYSDAGIKYNKKCFAFIHDTVVMMKAISSKENG